MLNHKNIDVDAVGTVGTVDEALRVIVFPHVSEQSEPAKELPIFRCVGTFCVTTVWQACRMAGLCQVGPKSVSACWGTTHI
jgi:hypothetical protein